MSNPYPPQPGDPSQYFPQGVPGQHPPPAPPAPAAKKRKWPWIVAGVVGFLIVVSSFSDDADKTEAAEPSSSPTVAAETAPTAAVPVATKLNTPVRDGKFEFVVTGVQPGLAEVGDNPFLNQKAQGQFVIVTLSVQNIGDKPQGFSPSDQKLFDTEGRSFESDAAAQIALGTSDVPLWDNINPGNTVTVQLVYDMPAAAVPARIELHDSMFSGGVTVDLTP